jgi:hypothetical protein
VRPSVQVLPSSPGPSAWGGSDVAWSLLGWFSRVAVSPAAGCPGAVGTGVFFCRDSGGGALLCCRVGYGWAGRPCGAVAVATDRAVRPQGGVANRAWRLSSTQATLCRARIWWSGRIVGVCWSTVGVLSLSGCPVTCALRGGSVAAGSAGAPAEASQRLAATRRVSRCQSRYCWISTFVKMSVCPSGRLGVFRPSVHTG